MKIEWVPPYRRCPEPRPLILIQTSVDGRRSLFIGWLKITWRGRHDDPGDPDSYEQPQ